MRKNLGGAGTSAPPNIKPAKRTHMRLTAHPNEIKGVIGENYEMALGAIQAIKGRGLNVKDFVVVGIDGVPDAINAVKAGEMFSILQDAEGQAAGALDVVLRAKLGESYEPKAAVWKQWEKEMPWNGGTGKAYFIPWTEITPEKCRRSSEASKGADKRFLDHGLARRSGRAS
jgi:putative xylitol transport system substrate-binding protein